MSFAVTVLRNKFDHSTVQHSLAYMHSPYRHRIAYHLGGTGAYKHLQAYLLAMKTQSSVLLRSPDKSVHYPHPSANDQAAK